VNIDDRPYVKYALFIHICALVNSSESTLRRRRDEWIELGLVERLRLVVVLDAYDRFVGLECSEVAAVDCCLTKAPCGGEKAGKTTWIAAKEG
jgi:hypothetical protein